MADDHLQIVVIGHQRFDLRRIGVGLIMLDIRRRLDIRNTRRQ
jgi:hypothetical protein